MHAYDKSIGLMFPCFLCCVCALSVFAEDDLLTLGKAAPSIATANFIRGNAIQQYVPNSCYVLEFTGTACGACIAAQPEMHRLADEFRNVTFVAVFSERDEDAIRKFVAKFENSLPSTLIVDSDGTIWNSYATASGWNGIPLTVVVDGRSNVAWIGRPDGLGERLRAIVANTHTYQEDAEMIVINRIKKRQLELRSLANERETEAAKINQLVEPKNTVEEYDVLMKMLDEAIEEYKDLDICDAFRSQRVVISGGASIGKEKAYTLAIDYVARKLDQKAPPCYTLLEQFKCSFPQNKDNRILDLVLAYLSLSENEKLEEDMIALRNVHRAEVAALRQDFEVAFKLIAQSIETQRKLLRDVDRSNEEERRMLNESLTGYLQLQDEWKKNAAKQTKR
ncbi:MAG: TlpA disulfide reductase family protein [Pirellula sp.]